MVEKQVWPNVKDKGKGKVKELYQLNPGQPEGRYTGHIELELPNTDFMAGDVCMVMPVNDPRQVDRLLQLLRVAASDKVTYAGETVTAGDLFARKIEIAYTADKLVALIDERRKDGKITAKDIGILDKALGDAAMRKGLEPLSVADVIEYFGIEGITPQDLADRNKKLNIRAYTASSSPLAYPGQVHMTFALVEDQYPLGERSIQKYGVATDYMRSLKQGEDVTFFMQPKKLFRLPSELDRPLIMVGPGTGIAPFRAMVQEIQARGGKHSDVILYTGGPYLVDQFYKEEMGKAYEQGVLTQPAHYAISREGSKQRVTALLERDRVDIKKLIDAGALIYICGSKTMGHDVVKKLTEISPDLKEMAKERIREDTY